MVKLVLAGDTMLGRGVAHVLATSLPSTLFSDEVVAAFGEGDLGFVNLECCISTRGRPWPDPAKPFFFRAPPAATKVLTLLGVHCVSLANNHALDFGTEALLDTFDHLKAAGIEWVGAGPDIERARQPVVLEVAGMRLAVVAFTDHPAEYAAGRGRPGVAYANLRHGTPRWLLDTVKAAATEADAVLVSPHWGPNMRASPLPYVQRAASELRGAGATLVAGHSAHVFQGVEDQILYDLGDFIDDYLVDLTLRNDLGLLFLVTLDPRPQLLEAIPLALDFCHTRLAAATGDEAAWVRQRFRSLCAEFGTDVAEHRGHLVIEWAESRTVEEDLEEALVPGGHVDNGGDDPPGDVDYP
jgi:poly-gamma-glutamate capsule biosynthesis protein CapA/YwtB (metallophosphatase superfamily)